MRPGVSSVLRASFAALSDALFPQIPVCPGTHIKTVSLLSALISVEETAKRSEFGYTREQRYTKVICYYYYFYVKVVFVLAEDGPFLRF